ncbi:MAG: histidine kinase [Desulfobacterales bacterium]|jgi:signal transduction histidine kinase|nr:histidine kinase [Desulfobacterales bacterium]
MNRKPLYDIAACICLGLMGFFANWFNFELFFNVDFLMGSFFVMLAILLLGELFGIITGFVAATCTFFLWNHPWAIIIMTAEAAFVAVSVNRRRGDPIISNMTYWAFIGMPLVYFFYHHVMAIQLQSTFLIMLKQAMNGIFNCLIATIVFLLLKKGRRSRPKRIGYSQAIFVTMVSFVIVPAMLFLVIGMRLYLKHETAMMIDKLSASTTIAQKSLANWIKGNHQVIHTLSVLVGDPDKTPASVMQHYVDMFKSSAPAFSKIGVLNRQATTVAYAPMMVEGRSTLGVDFSDRPYISIMKRKKQPFIPDVMMGKLGNPVPIAMLLAPIVIDGNYKGYVSGVIDISGLISDIKQLAAQEYIHFTLVDAKFQVIASSHTDQKIMEVFQPPYPVSPGQESPKTFHWVPEAPAGTSIMQRWRSSIMVKTCPIIPECDWRLIAETSILPLVEQISLFSIKGLALLSFLTAFTVVLAHMFSKGFVSTVRKLQYATRSLPERLTEETTIDWPESRIIEIEALCENFREMSQALDISFKKQKQINETLEKRVIERTTALRESEERLRFALESAQMGTFDYQLTSGKVFWDNKTKKFKDINVGSPLGYQDVLAMIHPEDRQRIDKEIKQALDPGSDGAVETEFRLDLIDNTVHWTIVRGRVYFEGKGADRRPARMSGTYLDATDRKRIELELEAYRQHLERLVEDRTRELEKKNELLQLEICERNQIEKELRGSREQLRTLASRLQVSREQERIHVAREIHDVMAQELTRLKFDVIWLQRVLKRHENSIEIQSLADRISEMGRTTDTVIQSVQKIATELRPAVLDSLGLSAAVEWQARDFQARSGIACQVSVPEEQPSIGRDGATTVFRVLQESLTNVIRHAGATHVDIMLQEQNKQCILIVKDNGCGISPNIVTNPLSIGLTGMRERALLLGGQFSICGRPESGTVVELCIPLISPKD